MLSNLDLARRALRMTDKGALIADQDAASLARRLGFVPDQWQADMLTSDEPGFLLNCSRQSGKSTVTALLALYEALATAASLILLLSPSQRQSGELFRKVMDFYGRFGSLTGYYPTERETVLTAEFSNGSRIVSLPGKEGTIRGYSGARRILIDEAARVSDDLYYSIRPMLAVSGGRLGALSTPFGKKGWFFEEWEHGEGWQRFRVPATECPRIPPDFLAAEKKSMGLWWFNQEYLCQFEDAETAAFAYEDVQAAFSEKVEAWEL